MRSTVIFAAVCLAAAPQLSAQLLRDINTLPQGSSGNPANAYPGDFFESQGRLYFSATTGATGRELWWIDGTGAPPQLLADVAPGVDDANPRDLAEIGNGLLIFTAEHPNSGREVWISDGSAAGTILLADIAPGISTSQPKSLCSYQGNGYFLARTQGALSYDLWRTDGTAAGTFAIESLGLTGGYAGNAQMLVSTPAGLYYTASHVTSWPNGEWRLYKSPGTAGGAQLLAQVTETNQYGPRELTALGSGVVLIGNGGGYGREVWVSDGTPAGTAVVDLFPGVDTSNPSELTRVGSRVYFVAKEAAAISGGEVFATDGTVAGTQQVTTSTYDYTRPVLLRAAGSLLTYATSDFTYGAELWATSGGVGTEVLYADFAAGVTGGNPAGMVALAGGVACIAQTPSTGREPFFSDGTPAGTFVLRDIKPGADGSDPGSMFVFQNRAYFSADDGFHGFELWSTDGTPAGTQLYADLAAPPANQSSYPQGFTSLGDRALFAATDGFTGLELWATDGTPGGTVRLTDYNGTGDSITGGPWQPMAFGGRAVFAFDDGVHGLEPWISDGTATGTKLLRDIKPGSSSSFPAMLGVWRGELYFAARRNTFSGYDLYATDGSTNGTRLVAGYTGNDGVRPDPFVVHQGRLYFSAWTAAHGSELWSTDGTAAGTSMVVDLNPGTGNGVTFFEAGSLGGHLYFSGTDAGNDFELWRTDGTPGGTTLVANLNPSFGSGPFDFHRIGSQLVFGAIVQGQGQYFGTDGTTVQQLTFPPLYINGNWQLYEAGSRLIGLLRGAGGSSELWGTDGTVAGSGIIRQIGANSTEFTNLRAWRVSSGDKLLFLGNTAATGTELFITDGTFVGTGVFADVRPGPDSSWPSTLVRVGDQLVFDAFASATGWEPNTLPWSLVDEWLAEPAGSPCANAGGELASYSTSGSASPGATLNVHVQDAPPSVPALHYWSPDYARIDLGSCVSYLAQPVFGSAGTTDASGADTLSIAVPNTPTILGANLWLQSVLVDPGGNFFGLGGLTPALEVRVGN